MQVAAISPPLEELRAIFGERLRENVPIAPYTSARIGGAADALVLVNSADELAEAVKSLWAIDTEFFILGGGSNVLVSDLGVRELILINKARAVRIDEKSDPISVFAQSGANLGVVARQTAQKGLSGLEWAAGIPGTVGGAVFGNAGAHGGDIAANLLMADILHRKEGRKSWTEEDLEFSYRSSKLKREKLASVVLAASLRLWKDKPESITERMDSYLAYRRKTQPPGASMGSMFKNPTGDFAGRLIEAAGLKGKQIGAAQVSPLHANFFLNHGDATAVDVMALIQFSRDEVKQKFDVDLELEIELVGEWA